MTPRITGRHADGLTYVFYAAIVAIAGIGCATAATAWTDWSLWAILPAVGLLELSAVALLVRADHRRRLGERAVSYRVLAVAVGMLAVAINVFGHLPNTLAAAFFGGFSALGLGVALLMSGDRRRDHLRATGNLPPTTPAYGVWQWVRRPWTTWRAKEAAKRTPSLGLYGSLAAAVDEKRTEVRHSALAALLTEVLTQGRDDLTARVAVATLDMDEITRRFAAAADYDAVVRELWSRAPIGAADHAAVEPSRHETVTAEVVSEPTPITAGRGGAHRHSDRDARRIITGLAAAEPGISTRDLARLSTRAPRTVREILAAVEKTGENPVIEHRDNGGRMGFQPPQN